jgi:soluble lytic murein transglycosylase-like protein
MPRAAWLAAAAMTLAFAPLAGQNRKGADRYDHVFSKYSKRYFGPGYDWRVFKAQAMAESNLDPDARSGVGAQGVMQLMPSTFREIQTKNPDIGQIDDPQWNIAAGISYDRTLWRLWERDTVEVGRDAFMLGSYNAGRVTIRKAQTTALQDQLDHRLWTSIETVAPKVARWRHRETLDYVRRIEENLGALDDKGRLRKSKVTAAPATLR